MLSGSWNRRVEPVALLDWSFQNQHCHLFHPFYQVQIRLGPSFLRLRGHGKNCTIVGGKRDDTANTAIIGQLTTITPDSLATADPTSLLLDCQQIAMSARQHKLSTDQRARVIDA
jgi:hypothetical protein